MFFIRLSKLLSDYIYVMIDLNLRLPFQVMYIIHSIQKFDLKWPPTNEIVNNVAFSIGSFKLIITVKLFTFLPDTLPFCIETTFSMLAYINSLLKKTAWREY